MQNKEKTYLTLVAEVANSGFLCHSKNKPPALQVEGISSDKSNSCAKIDVGLQTTNKKAQEVQKWTITV